MGIYIIEDDDTMIEILEDLIEDYEMGEVVGSSTDPSEALLQVPALRPDIIMIDFLMPGKDGAQLVRELKEAGCTAKFIMVSQVSSKDMIGKAYDAGIEFFISKPINLIEVKSILNTVTQQIKNERTVAQLRNLFMTEIGFGDGKGAEAGSSTGTAPAVRNTPEQKTPAEIRQGSVPQGAQPPKKASSIHFEEKKPPSKLSHAVRDAPLDALLIESHRKMRESADGNAQQVLCVQGKGNHAGKIQEVEYAI